MTPTLPTRPRTLKARQPGVDLLLFQIKAVGLPAPKTEFQFHATRKWTVDIGWPYITNPLICEVDGGLYMKAKDGQAGRHSRGSGREKDYERDAEALKLGYRILRVSPRQVKNGQAIQWLQDLLYGEK